MLPPEYPLRTKRLHLRPLRLSDLDALHDIESRPEVARYEYWDPQSRQETADSLAKNAGRGNWEEAGQWLTLAIVLADGESFIGTVSLEWKHKEWRQGELGYMLHPDHQGFGYATEAAEEMLRLGFDELGLHRIIARAEPRNTASVKVMKRLGMRHEAYFRHSEYVKGEWCDDTTYAILDEEFGKR
jgi:RimJ/RimL family protein N-acetyltransferase